MKKNDMKKLAEKMQKALGMGDNMKLSSNFEDKVWQKIGEPNPSFMSTMARFFYTLRPAFAISGAVALILAVAVTLNIKEKPSEVANVIATPPIRTAITIAKDDEKITSKEAKVLPAIKEGMHAQVNNAIPQKEIANMNEPTVVEQLQNSPAYAPPVSADAVKITARSAAETQVKTANKPPVVTPAIEQKTLTVGNNVIHPLQNETVTIRYSVRERTAVTVIVYDRKGRAIKRLYKGIQEPGNYLVTWGGTDDNGNVVPDGTYILYVKTDLTEQKIKLGIIK